MGLWSKISGTGKKAAAAPVSTAKKLIGYDQARDNWDWMRSLAKGLLPSSMKAGRVETFDHAMARQDVTNEDLDRIYTNHVLRFWISVLLFFTGLAIGANYVFDGNFFALLPLTGFGAVCLSQMFSGSFRAHQVASRKFCDVSEWLARRDVWIPRGFSIPAPPPVKKTGTAVASRPASSGTRPKNPTKKE